MNRLLLRTIDRIGRAARGRMFVLTLIVIALAAFAVSRSAIAESEAEEPAAGAAPAAETAPEQPAPATVAPAESSEPSAAEPDPVPTETTAPPADAAAPATNAAESSDASPAVPAAPPEKPVVIPFEYQPYAVSVSLSFEEDVQFSTEYRARVRQELANGLERTYGRMWNVDVAETGDVRPASTAGLARLVPEELRAQAAAAGKDKVFPLTIRRVGSRYLVAGCEWDAASDSLGDTVQDETWERGEVAEKLLDMMIRLFRPVASIDDVDGYKAVVKVRGGAFPALDPRADQVRDGDLFEPFFRYLNKDKSLAKVQQITFTYLVVEQIEQGRAECELLTGLVSALGGKARRRVDRLALRVRPAHPETRVELSLLADPTRVMRGMHVSVYPKTHLRDEADGPPMELIADRQGTIAVPTNPDRLLFWIYAHSGNAALARVPIVPGVRPTLRLELGDDSIRLECEGDVELLRGKIIAVVAARSALMAKTQAFADQSNWLRVKEEMEKLGKLPTIEQFESQVTAIREPAVEAARKAKDRKAEGRIQKLCTDTSALIRRYLDDEKLKTFREGIQERLKAIEDDEKK